MLPQFPPKLKKNSCENYVAAESQKEWIMGPNGSNQVKTWSEETHLSLLVCVGPRNTVHLLYISCELVLKWWCFCGPIWELQKYLRTLWAKLSNIYKTQKRWKKDDVCLYLLLFKGVNQTSWCVPNFKLDSWGENTDILRMTFCPDP